MPDHDHEDDAVVSRKILCRKSSHTLVSQVLETSYDLLAQKANPNEACERYQFIELPLTPSQVPKDSGKKTITKN